MGLWMSELSAHDADFRGWSRNPKGRRPDLSVSPAAFAEPTQFSREIPAASLGMVTLQGTWLHQSMKKATTFSPEKELAGIRTVWNNHT